jgi:sugar phosphate isomerase/epimerase
MRIANTHIGYCLNIYPGETAADIAGHIARECPGIKAAVCPRNDMGVGLWLAAKAVLDLKQAPHKLKKQLGDQGLYAFTVNAFPFGDFHSRPVKERVYQPDWSTPERRDYTIDVAHILAHLLSEGVSGSISTVPVAYGKKCPPQALGHLVAVAAQLEKLESRTGRLIRLAIEPEPDCYLERIDECIVFFEKLRKLNRTLVNRYLGVCLDVCHCALQFEDPVLSLRQLENAGVLVPKIQVSAALEIEDPTVRDMEHLQAFDDGVYFHQTRVRNKKNDIKRYADLPQALAAGPAGKWRVHFHVPLQFQSANDNLRSTTPLLGDDFFQQAIKSTSHLETETYTYAVLPQKHQDSSASATVSAELQFVAQAVRRVVGGDIQE